MLDRLSPRLAPAALLLLGTLTANVAAIAMCIDLHADGAILCARSDAGSSAGAEADCLPNYYTTSSSTVPAPLDWAPLGGASERGFHANSTSRILRFRAELLLTQPNATTQTISVENLSDQSVDGASLLFVVSPCGASSPPSAAGLAKLLYGYQRGIQQHSGNEWRLSDPTMSSKNNGVYFRHHLVVVSSENPSSLIPPDSDNGLEYWTVKTEVPAIAADSEITLAVGVRSLPTSIIELAATGYDRAMYLALPGTLGTLSRGTELLIEKIRSVTGSLGLSMIILAALIRVVLLPVTYWSLLKQKHFARISKAMQPELERIKKSYKGAEQSEKILDVYKQHGVSPFYGLKASVGLFVQIPFLLAVFNVTTESSMFLDAGFLWMSDLSTADALIALPFQIPFLGDSINALPLALGAANVFSTSKSSDPSTKSSPMPTVFSIIIVLLFYTISAAVVLYWLVANILQIGERAIFERRLNSAA